MGRDLPFEQHCCYAVKVEDEIDFVGVRILDDGVHGSELGGLSKDDGLARKLFVFDLFAESAELVLVLSRLFLEAPLDVLDDHVDGDSVLDASRDDDVCRAVRRSQTRLHSRLTCPSSLGFYMPMKVWFDE